VTEKLESMLPYLIYTLILLVVINLYFWVAVRFNIIDKPCERSSHSKPVLRGGGIIFPVGLILWFIWSGFAFPWFFAGLMLISLVSFIDDLAHVSYKIRLVMQITAISLLLIQLGLAPLPWWVWFYALFTATAVINAFNFMDGINGITAGYSLSALIGLWIVNNYQVSFVGNDLLYAAGIAVVIFGFYNFRTRARCFAGDVGAVSISFILVFLTGKLILATGNPFYLMFMVIYGVDTFLTIIFRLIRRENIFEAHRSHLFQILANESGFSHPKVSSAYTLAQLLINLLVIVLAGQVSLAYQLLVSVGIMGGLAAVYVYVKGK